MAYDFTSWDAGLHGEDPNSLQHYGVLGMKWGQRRYQNSDGSLTAAGERHYAKTGEYGYNYKSHATKKYNRKSVKAGMKSGDHIKKALMSGDKKEMDKAKKYADKAQKFKKRADRSEELDRREQDYATRVRAGGNIITRLLTGNQMGGKAYQQHLAMNKDTKSAGSKVTAAGMSYLFGRVGSAVRKANYIRQGEKTAKRAAKGKAADRVEAFKQKAAQAKAKFENGVNNAANLAKEEQRKRRRNNA